MSFSRLSGRIAIVTASTDGIGFAIAQRFAREGAKVIISSRNDENVQVAKDKLLKEGLNVTGLVCHVGKAEDRAKLLQTASSLGGLDILVSNAAVNPEVVGILDCSSSAWDKIFDVNVKSSHLLTKEAIPFLKKSKAGRIIYISSIAGLQPLKTSGAYGVSKTALLGLMKTASLQLAPENITVNTISPGLILTRFSNVLIKTPSEKSDILDKIPMNRFGQPHEVGGCAAFLASDDASYITGENIVVAGGMASRL
ncbi:dehydrogenase/reductase SDR family member 4-like [Rhynchophorus ferrugineus]|uniref:Dehydrogenase/reductase SDR family member 4 n=1 Tax=Rhynchophorus ferrugineus TaxID=354439 RepID=A0A834I876_RHYFE|nr:hypothetical protein GWI33_017961 [Rhynchophorus ferrugineus]